MSLGENETFALVLEEQLRKAGLPTNPAEVMSQIYRFGCEHGSHHQILVGTVLAIEISDEGSLELHVSNPTFWNQRLISLMYGNSGWMAYVDIKPREWSEVELERMADEERQRVFDEDLQAKFFHGEFALLGKQSTDKRITTTEDYDMDNPIPSHASVARLPLSFRAENILRNAGIQTVGQLAQKTEREIGDLPNAGKRVTVVIREALEKLGRRLGELP